MMGGLGTDWAWARAGTGHALGTDWARVRARTRHGRDWARTGHGHGRVGHGRIVSERHGYPLVIVELFCQM
jgi:hypothetical protein